MIWHTKLVLCVLAYFDQKKVHFKAKIESFFALYVIQFLSADPTQSTETPILYLFCL